MTFEEFVLSLDENTPPAGTDQLLVAMWHDGRGDWSAAHDIVQDIGSRDASHLHAYLHRKEGDLWNADYWYRRAETTRPDVDLRTEWEQLVRMLLR